MNQKNISKVTILALISILSPSDLVCPPRSGTTFKAQGKSATMPDQKKDYILKNMTAFEEALKQFMINLPSQTNNFVLHDNSGDHTWNNLKDVRMYVNQQWTSITEEAQHLGVDGEPHCYEAKKRIDALLATTLEAIDKRIAEQNK